MREIVKKNNEKKFILWVISLLVVFISGAFLFANDFYLYYGWQGDIAGYIIFLYGAFLNIKSFSKKPKIK